jgi:glycosyltransferase involved in cell wall biosynthesis
MVILEYLPLVGGAQRQLASIAPLLARRGVDVHVLTRHAGSLPEREEVDGARVYRLPAPGPKPTASLGFTVAALARLAALRPDVVHAYSLFSPATIAVLAKRMLGAATLVKVLRGGHEGDVARLRTRTGASLRIRQLRNAIDAFAVISDEIDAELAALGIPDARRHRIPNGVDTDRFRPAPPELRRAHRRALGLPHVPTAVYCGRLVRAKNLDVLLDAWRTLQQRRPESSLVIVGGGPEATMLRRAAGPGVRFVGEQGDVLPYLQAADAFVLCSAAEGQSNAMLEAMAVGLPIVATRVGAAAELVTDPVAGRLVEPGDAQALCAALAATLFDPARVESGLRGRGRMLDEFALPSVADRLAGLYAALAAAPGARVDRSDRAAAEEVRA